MSDPLRACARRVAVAAVAALLVLPVGGGEPAAADATIQAAVVGISPNDTPAQIRAKAAGVTPSPRQLAW